MNGMNGMPQAPAPQAPPTPKNNYPTFPNPAGIGSCMGYEKSPNGGSQMPGQPMQGGQPMMGEAHGSPWQELSGYGR